MSTLLLKIQLCTKKSNETVRRLSNDMLTYYNTNTEEKERNRGGGNLFSSPSNQKAKMYASPNGNAPFAPTNLRML